MSSSSQQDTPNMSWDDYMKSLKISYEEIKSATNDFADENIFHKPSPSSSSSSNLIYKGQLKESGAHFINVLAQKFNKTQQHMIVFKTFAVSYHLKHRNIVSLFKTAENSEWFIIINKYEVNESLDKYLRGATLTWIQRLHICVRVAHALRYIHNCNADGLSVIHGNIKSSKILLDENWEPRLNGFESSLWVKKNHLYITNDHNGTLEYMDPAYQQSGGLTYKSDVFSFGVVLFEVLFGRIASFNPNEDKLYFARLARFHYEAKTLDDLIDTDLRKQIDLESLNIFSETAYYCLKELRSERPDMVQIVRKLETALNLQQKHETPEHPTVGVQTTSSNHLKGKNLDHLKIRLTDIELATNKFSNTYCIGSGGYGMVYKAKLYHFDGINSPATEWKNKGELPKTHSTVAIKRIFARVDGQAEESFFAEIEMLSNCKHPNIVSLLGFCDEGPEMILVYEYASNGSLSDYLGNVDNMTNLSWAQRIQICLDVAHGLNYLHTSTQEKKTIIHRDIKSANILLDDNWVAKIADFGLSKLHHPHKQGSTLMTSTIAGTDFYLDPEYHKTGKLKTKSDIYSFGVVLFEMMCGRLAYDGIYEEGLPAKARKCFTEGALNEMVDPKISGANENTFMLNGWLNQDSLDTFSRIAYRCLAETQSDRPTMEVVIQELKKASDFQKNSKDSLEMSFKDIKLATQNFSDQKCIGEGRHWKQYVAEIPHANGLTTVIAKRWDTKSLQANQEYFTELKTILEKKHENIVALVGYCNQMDEKIILYEHASRGRLDKYLNDASVTWMKRLKMCIDVAKGLQFIHILAETHQRMLHRDIKSVSILIDSDWRAKISNLELSSLAWKHKGVEHITDDNAYGSLGYVCPEYKKDGCLTEKSDVYSLGVVLMEMLCGRLAWGDGCQDRSHSLGPLVKRHYHTKGNLDEMVFEDIMEQICPKSLTAFIDISLQCLNDDPSKRPDAIEVVKQLKKALEFQEDYEIWEPKMPKDYKEIFQMSKTPDIYNSIQMKKDLYNMLRRGILLQEGKMWFSLGGNGERNEMISAKKFTYKNSKSRKWQSISESRFEKVAEMLIVSSLKIKINIRNQFLSPGVNYGVHLVFKFCGPIKSSSKTLYVNLMYKMGSETFHAYFATWRDEEWMMIELCRFLNHKKYTNFEVLLESFSQYYCGRDGIYIEGIEFRAIDNVNNEEIVKIKEVEQVLKSNTNMDQVEQLSSDGEEICKRSENNDVGEKVLSLNERNEKKHLILSAKEVLYNSSNMKCFHLKPSAESRFHEVIEVLPQQVLGIKCKIESQMLLPGTNYMCYLVFKLSEKSRGLHCPVKVRDVLHWKNKETGILYFRPPKPCNLYDNIWAPRERVDGWMEVTVWRFNSASEIRNDCIPMNLKLITYEGTMSGLIVCGLEIRPM